MTEPESRAAPFSDMATRIGHNAGSEFGGAVVIVPPGDGPVIEMLLLNKVDDRTEAAFWSLLKARTDMVLADIQDRERQAASGFGRR